MLDGCVCVPEQLPRNAYFCQGWHHDLLMESQKIIRGESWMRWVDGYLIKQFLITYWIDLCIHCQGMIFLPPPKIPRVTLGLLSKEQSMHKGKAVRVSTTLLEAAPGRVGNCLPICNSRASIYRDFDIVPWHLLQLAWLFLYVAPWTGMFSKLFSTTYFLRSMIVLL